MIYAIDRKHARLKNLDSVKQCVIKCNEHLRTKANMSSNRRRFETRIKSFSHKCWQHIIFACRTFKLLPRLSSSDEGGTAYQRQSNKIPDIFIPGRWHFRETSFTRIIYRKCNGEIIATSSLKQTYMLYRMLYRIVCVAVFGKSAFAERTNQIDSISIRSLCCMSVIRMGALETACQDAKFPWWI